jgi:MFS family permease
VSIRVVFDTAAATAAPVVARGPASRWRLITRYGGHHGWLYYALPVLAPAIAVDTGWSVHAVTGAFSAGLVVSALVGVPVGRWLDQIGPRLLMTAGR